MTLCPFLSHRGEQGSGTGKLHPWIYAWNLVVDATSWMVQCRGIHLATHSQTHESSKMMTGVRPGLDTMGSGSHRHCGVLPIFKQTCWAAHQPSCSRYNPAQQQPSTAQAASLVEHGGQVASTAWPWQLSQHCDCSCLALPVQSAACLTDATLEGQRLTCTAWSPDGGHSRAPWPGRRAP